MSEFTEIQQRKNEQILSFCLKIIKGENPAEVIKQNQHIIDTVDYRDVIWVTDALQKQGIPMKALKKGVNKVLNLFFSTLSNAQTELAPRNSFLGFLMRNNSALDVRLKEIRPLIRRINKNGSDKKLCEKLKNSFAALQKFDAQYVIKENILFPVLEKAWDDFRCVQIMWSFHDDIRRNLKSVVEELGKEEPDLKRINRYAGDIFFNMYAIKFREEKILFPRILETIPSDVLVRILAESSELPWPFVSPDKKLVSETKTERKNSNSAQQSVDLQTGHLLPEQIRWMMNHLPVDVTYVDENNKVCYFSTPKKRIFPRTLAVIERDVRNCHPQESVHIVEKIVEAFRKGERDHADFWIQMKDGLVYIRYFAIRDEEGNYKGVLEVSQEVSDIKNLKGEKKLLNWW